MKHGYHGIRLLGHGLERGRATSQLRIGSGALLSPRADKFAHNACHRFTNRAGRHVRRHLDRWEGSVRGLLGRDRIPATHKDNRHNPIHFPFSGVRAIVAATGTLFNIPTGFAAPNTPARPAPTATARSFKRQVFLETAARKFTMNSHLG